VGQEPGGRTSRPLVGHAASSITRVDGILTLLADDVVEELLDWDDEEVAMDVVGVEDDEEVEEEETAEADEELTTDEEVDKEVGVEDTAEDVVEGRVDTEVVLLTVAK
jgi:hypothetical protein